MSNKNMNSETLIKSVSDFKQEEAFKFLSKNGTVT